MKLFEMSNIPSLDLNDFLSDDTNRKQSFVSAVGKAYQEIGFLSLKGHFLSKNIDDLYKQIKLFLIYHLILNQNMSLKDLKAKEVTRLLAKNMQKEKKRVI